MGVSLFHYGVNIVAFNKNNIKYGMSCSWAMQVDYDKVCLLLGEQSVTGKNIIKGDIIGVSALSENQEQIAISFGENHSNEVDKFKGIEFTQSNNAITINNARVQMIVEVIDVIHLQEIETDRMIYGRVLKSNTNDYKYLSLEDL